MCVCSVRVCVHVCVRVHTFGFVLCTCVCMCAYVYAYVLFICSKMQEENAVAELAGVPMVQVQRTSLNIHVHV